MNVSGVHVILVTFVIGSSFVQCQINIAKEVKDTLVNMGKTGDDKDNNKYLDEFLDAHSHPRIVWDNVKNFDLNIDTRFTFKPTIKMAPFRSTGEPWPRPKMFTTTDSTIYRMNTNAFRLEVQGEACDVIDDAVRRYTVIIKNRTMEEPYEFAFNYNKKTLADHEALRLKKYENIRGELKNLKISVKNMDAGYPHIDMDESYTLKVTEDEVSLHSNEVWGALRGLETFSQLLFRKRDTQEIYVRRTEIEDTPRFPHRGILMDTSRHYMHKYVIENVLDGMSYNKFNVLHWHMTDDNSFPYQSKVFPDLSKKGAFHPTLVYSLEDLKDLVAYARLRGIRVVPEFDTPGHMFSWLGVPDMKGTCYHSEGEAFKGPIGPIDLASDKSYQFMSDLFSEIFDVFPDVFMHLGGDELQSKCWATNPSIVEHLEKHANMRPEDAKRDPTNYVHRAIGYYFKRLIGTLKETSQKKSRGASFIMWEDVLKNTKEIPKDSILEVWMNKQSMVKSINSQGYRTIYSSCWYLDNYKNYVLWVDYYNCEPSPYFTEEEEKGKLLGGEACLWAEYITTDNLMTMMWPRASAPAERLWSPRNVRDVGNAARRIQEQRCRMIYRGLPTGHIDGPDHCLRYLNEPLGGHDPLKLNTPTAGINTGVKSPSCETNYRDVEESIGMSVVLMSDYQKYLPFVNITLSALGVYGIIVVSRYLRRRIR